MKTLSRRSLVFVTGLWCLALFLPGALAANRPAGRNPAPKAADRFVRTKERIDNLLKSRLNPDPLPASLPNPFQLPAGMTLTEQRDGNPTDQPGGDSANPTIPATTGPVIPTNDTEALALYITGLKISGAVKLNGQLHLIINQSPYKEGDLILLNLPSTTVYLQVIRITTNELTLGFNQAVQTIKLKL